MIRPSKPSGPPPAGAVPGFYHIAKDELGVKWMVLEKEFLKNVMIRTDLKQLVITTGDGLLICKISDIKGSIGGKADLTPVTRNSKND